MDTAHAHSAPAPPTDVPCPPMRLARFGLALLLTGTALAACRPAVAPPAERSHLALANAPAAMSSEPLGPLPPKRA
jgi:hypothetical protein